MDAEKSETNQNYRISFAFIGLWLLAFFTIFVLWNFDVFYSADDYRELNCAFDSTEKNKPVNAIDSFYNNRFIRILLLIKNASKS